MKIDNGERGTQNRIIMEMFLLLCITKCITSNNNTCTFKAGFPLGGINLQGGYCILGVFQNGGFWLICRRLRDGFCLRGKPAFKWFN